MTKINSSIADNIVKKTFKSVLIAQLFSFLSQVISMVVDGVITGKCLGTDALAAYGFANTVVSIIVAFAGFSMTGISILCARCIGDTDEEKRTSAFTTSMVFAVILSVVIMAIVVIFSDTWAALAGSTGLLTKLTSQYIIGFGIGIIPTILVSSIYPIMQLDGDKNRMIISFAAMSIADIVLDLLNGYVLHWGIFGMGLATAISAYVALVILLGHFFNADHMFCFKLSTFKIYYIREIIIFGYMYIVKQLLMTILTFVFNNYLMHLYGADMVAAYTAIASAGSLCLCLGMSIGSTVSVLTSVYAGEKDGGTLRRMMKISIYYSILLNGVLTVIIILLSTPLLSAYFDPSKKLFDVAVTGFRLYCLVMIFRSINLCIRGYYQSMKMQKLTFIFSVLHAFLCTLIAMFFMGEIIGINGVWLSFVVGEFVALILLILYTKLTSGNSQRGISALLFIPKDYEIEDDEIMEKSLNSMEQITNYSKEIQDFCLAKGASPTTANHIALAIEELAGNVIHYGFADGKQHSIDIRVTSSEEDWFVRIRDDCDSFNPVKYAEEHTETALDCIGIRMITKQAKEINYMNTLNLNNLVIRL